jgi:hypothetical protein
MKLVRFFLKGVLLALLTSFVTGVVGILLYVLSYGFGFAGPLAEGVVTADLSNPWTYFIMHPAIALSIFFSRKTYSLQENIFEANSLKEALLEGFGWAAIQFGLLISIFTITSGIQRALEQFVIYLVTLGVFIGPLINYVFQEYRSEAPKEKRGVIIAVITIILFCVGVPLSLYLYPTSSNASNNTSNNASINTIGNTSGNLANGGEAALQGEWIYYSNDGLYKIKTDGTAKTKISSEGATHINVIGDWIYYINGNVGSIYKIKIDGTGKTKLFDDNEYYYMNVIGDWIYYAGVSDSGGLYKIKTDGTEKTKISGEYFDPKTNVVNDWIYWIYYDYSYGAGYGHFGKLYKIRTDGTGEIKIFDDLTADVNIVGDWVYYINYSDNSKLYKIKTDGTAKIMLIDDSTVASINVAGDWIYYSNQSNSFGLYKTKTDGTGKSMLIGDSVGGINVVGDWIYYYNYPWGEFKIRTDGSRRGKI